MHSEKKKDDSSVHEGFEIILSRVWRKTYVSCYRLLDYRQINYNYLKNIILHFNRTNFKITH